ncbi:ABC transporter permease [Streptomyces sp. NPDC127068]|uniref:ABC transporter permease n=1 Tax=Streptomyces sp. NPDC127068 TaxID=3347127 RepID=UPI0036687E90
MTYFRWALGRVGVAALTLTGVSILIFGAVRAMPGRYSDLVLGPLASRAEKDAAAERYGLDGSLPEQYVHWLLHAVRGDFGISMASQTPVASEFAERLPATVTLTALALCVTVLIGVPLGVLTGIRGSGGGRTGRLLGSLGLSLPEFVLGSLVVFVFTRYGLGLTVGAYVPWDQGPLRSVLSLALPAAVLAVFCTAAVARTTRDSVLGVLVEPHIAAAIARGESTAHIVRHHVLRNASIPVLTLLATLTAYLLGGAVIVERLFNTPGLGSFLVDGLDRRDYAIVQAGVLLAATVFIVVNVLVDIVCGIIDPRISNQAGSTAT